ncbi:RloB family protein [Saccharibacillus sacchari]|uniref:RloB family protein n=1 Tax=Saccharibacillus sacchari TaxID=456493 RepID=A0ACC6PI24_9BACL
MANRIQTGKKPRKENKRNANPSGHLIVSEGVNTEVNYFNGFKEDINRKFEGTIASYTIDIHGADKESIRAENFDNAIKMAEARGIRVAWSNECIELWFLLHFSYLHTPISREAYYTKLSAELKKRGGPANSSKF